MRLGKFFIRLFSQGKKEDCSVRKTASPVICTDQSGRYELFSEIVTLWDVFVLRAKGVWGQEDFLILKGKVRVVPRGIRILSVWRQLDTGNIVYENQLFDEFYLQNNLCL